MHAAQRRCRHKEGSERSLCTLFTRKLKMGFIATYSTVLSTTGSEVLRIFGNKHTKFSPSSPRLRLLGKGKDATRQPAIRSLGWSFKYLTTRCSQIFFPECIQNTRIEFSHAFCIIIPLNIPLYTLYLAVTERQPSWKAVLALSPGRLILLVPRGVTTKLQIRNHKNT